MIVAVGYSESAAIIMWLGTIFSSSITKMASWPTRRSTQERKGRNECRTFNQSY